MDEHLRKSNMLVIRPDEGLSSPGDTAEDVEWKMVCAMVENYTRVHPKEMQELLQENRVIRESMLNQHGSGSDGLRWGMRLPPGLVRIIDRRFPKFLVTKSNLHRFMEHWKEFRVCETV